MANDFDFYGYNPNKILPVIAAAIFGIAFAAHTFISIRTRSINYWWCFVVGAMGETIGYALRRVSAGSPTVEKWYLGQELPLVLAPAVMAASIYQTYGRTVLYVGEKYSPIRARWVTRTFVSFDVFSFVIQGGGGGLYTSKNPHTIDVAKAILMAGFLIQIASFSTFFVFSIIYHRRAIKEVPRGRWERCLQTLWVANGFILIRSIFRVVEFGDGTRTSGIQAHEGLFYGLETLPILISVIVLAVSHPSSCIPSKKDVRMVNEHGAAISRDKDYPMNHV